MDTRGKKGLIIKSIEEGSLLSLFGFKPGDRVVSVDEQPVERELEFTFYSSEPVFEIQAVRDGIGVIKERIERSPGEFLGVEFERIPVSVCRNKCIFCFVDQMPQGMRRELYVKDEDYFHSFMYGNYITMTSLGQRDFHRISEMGLSPLYISVHSTVPEVRKYMLNNNEAGCIMEQLKELADNGISFHTQIVVCPGINDSEVLRKTLSDLLVFDDSLLSAAVVPVGLTKHANPILRPVNRSEAEGIIRITDEFRRVSESVYTADELYIKAGIGIPESEYYGEYPQEENGVGLLRILLDEWEGIKEEVSEEVYTGRYLLVTSESAYPYISGVISEINRISGGAELIPVVPENTLFGKRVTVAGLMCARDIIRAVKNLRCSEISRVILPSVIFNTKGYTLDDWSLEDIERAVGRRVISAGDFQDVFKGIREVMNGEK